MRSSTAARHDPPLCTNLLEPAGATTGQRSPGPGPPAQGEEAGPLPGPGPLIVCCVLDSPALNELYVAFPWP